MDRLKNKVAVITGACSGIGLGTLELFVAEGARVLAADITAQRGAEIERRFPDRVKFQLCDVTREDELKATMQAATDHFGGLDILFSNAGAGGAANTVETMTAEAWDRSLNLLLRAAVLGATHAVPHMKKRGGGAIVNTSSVAALQAGLAPAAYSVAKAGVVHFTSVAAAQLAQHNIRVNAICPGFILTGIVSQGMRKMGASDEAIARSDAAMRQVAPSSQPIHKAGEPEDIARACLYLASEEAAFVTGTHLVVDGGLTIGPRHGWDPAEQERLLAEQRALAANLKI
jgi:NAD(P)-dependent dehydrogenase (short-subunit alcohol dehydrogenase family)